MIRQAGDRRLLVAAAAIAVAAALLGGLGGPVFARVIVVSAFVLVVPGVATLCWTSLEGLAAWVLLPCVGIAAVVLATSAAALAGWWSPPITLVLLAFGCMASCIVRLSRTSRLAAS